MLDTLTREQRADVIRRSLQWAKTYLNQSLGPRRLAGVSPPTPGQIAQALQLLDDGRRVTVQVLDTARVHIETVSGHPDDPVEQEVLRLITYAAARLDGCLATGLDPETMADEERALIATRAFEIAGAALDELDAERPELSTDVHVLSAALSMLGQRLSALASEPRTSRCTWCHLAKSVETGEWLQHALECRQSPGATAMRAIGELITNGDVRTGDLVRRTHREITALITAAENQRLLDQSQGQQHERDCPAPLEPHATCEEPLDDRSGWGDSVLKRVLPALHAMAARVRCDDCAPEYHCFDGSSPCTKRDITPPRSVADAARGLLRAMEVGSHIDVHAARDRLAAALGSEP